MKGSCPLRYIWTENELVTCLFVVFFRSCSFKNLFFCVCLHNIFSSLPTHAFDSQYVKYTSIDLEAVHYFSNI